MEVGSNHVDIDRYFDLGIELYNNEEYFLAHDCFEIVWNNVDKDKVFFQGLIQISVANFHYKKKSYNSAENQYNKGIEKLNKYLPYFLNVDVFTIVESSKNILESINKNDQTEYSIKIKKINKITSWNNLH